MVRGSLNLPDSETNFLTKVHIKRVFLNLRMFDLPLNLQDGFTDIGEFPFKVPYSTIIPAVFLGGVQSKYFGLCKSVEFVTWCDKLKK